MSTVETGQEGAPWLLARLSLVYNLDMVELSRGPGELLDPLILGALASASVAGVGHDPELEYAYAGLSAAPPDELRRATSIASLAASLRLPFETVRRRVKRLAAEGHCEITPKGVVQPEAAAYREPHQGQAIARFERTRQLYRDLLSIGVCPPPEARETPARLHAEAPVRLTNRLVGEYSLRIVDALMRSTGDLFRGLIVLQIARANGEHLDDLSFNPDAPLTDAERVPVAASALARRLRMPNETVRRHVKSLLADGLILRVKGGLILSTEGILGTGLGVVAHENAANIRRLFTRLDQMAVLAWWDGETEDC